VLWTAAVVVAVVHGLTVALMLTGSLLARRWPRVLWLHVPLVLTILALYASGSDCPLTALELELRDEAGLPGYRGGFIGHYVTEPMGFPIRAASTQIGVYAAAFGANLVGYGLLVGRHLRRTGAGTAEVEAVSRRRG
jgi:hypothetical protein